MTGLRVERLSDARWTVGDVWIERSRGPILGPTQRSGPNDAARAQELGDLGGSLPYRAFVRHGLW